MKADEFITRLRKEHNIIVSSENGQLKIKGDPKSLVPEIMEQLKAQKAAIAEFFETVKGGNKRQSIPPAPQREYYDLSETQKRIYFVHELDKSSVAYNIPVLLQLEGRVDNYRLEQAFNELVKRHESLRTYFEWVAGKPVQKIAPAVPFSISHITAAAGNTDEIISEFIRPFQLNQAPLFRVALIEQSPEKHLLVVDMHHIISDGVSLGILTADFMALYSNTPLPAVQVQYKDFVVWQQANEQKAKLEKQKEFWLNEFAEEVQVVDLPADFERPAVKTYKGDSLDFDISVTETVQLKNLAGKEGVTLFQLYLAVYNILIAKLCNHQDIVIGSSTAGRNHADLEHTIGMFVNTLPIRNFPSPGKTFLSFLQEVKAKVLECFNSQEYSYAALIGELNVKRDTSRNPLYDVMFDYQNFMEQTLEITGLTLKPYANKHDISKFDLTLTATEVNGKTLLHFEYDAGLFKKDTIQRFVNYFKKIVTVIINAPAVLIAEIGLLTEQETAQQLHHHPVNPGYLDGKTVLTLFEEQVIRTPDNIAVSYGQNHLTYKQLESLSNQLAVYLLANADVQPGDRVGIELDRSDWLLVAVLGILKSGAAYVPIDPAYPEDRKKYIASDSGIKLLISETYYLFNLDHYDGKVMAIDIELDKNRDDVAPLPNKPASSDLAYIIYTSGSTGLPKGVMIEHRTLANYIRWAADTYIGNNACIFPLYSSIAFDLTVTSVFTPLITGNRIMVYKEDEKRLAIENVMEEQVANVIKLTPSHLKIIRSMQLPADAHITRKVFIVGGEQLETRLALDIYNKFSGNVEIYNEYGPTETTVGCMIQRFEPDNPLPVVPIGLPISNLSIYILGASRELLPAGVKGELYIGGAGLARGYINNQQLTKERFVPNPFSDGELLYRSGDIGRWEPNGQITYFGRGDDQVKIRGYRIEPGEIEHHLSACPGVGEAAVQIYQKDDDARLVAYYTAPKPLADAELINFLGNRLPAYMVPVQYIWLNQMPLTGNGKLNRKKLPEPPSASGDQYEAPSGPEETLLADIWSKVLGVERVGVLDNFFAIGGDSIKSIQISSRLQAEGYEGSVKDIFSAKTIRQLALNLKRRTNTADQGVITGPVPLSAIQQWFFNGPLLNKNRFNQSVMLNFPSGVKAVTIRKVFEQLQKHHDALRMVFRFGDEGWQQENLDAKLPLSLEEKDLRNDTNAIQTISTLYENIQSSINLATGPLMKLGLYHTSSGSRLLIVVHHLVVDGVSWRILFEDIETLYHQAEKNESFTLPSKSNSFQNWVNQLASYRNSKQYKLNSHYWKQLLQKSGSNLRRDHKNGSNKVGESRNITGSLSREHTAMLLGPAHHGLNTQANDLLLTAFLLTVQQQYGLNQIQIDMEGHGREDIGGAVEVNRTVGWFTSIYPVLLEYTSVEYKQLIRSVKEQLRSIPANGLDYLLYQYHGCDGIKPEIISGPQISFNYLGQLDAGTGGTVFEIAGEYSPEQYGRSSKESFMADSNEERFYDWEILAIISGGVLSVSLRYSPVQYEQHNIESFMAGYRQNLEQLLVYCTQYRGQLLSPSDMTFKQLTIPQLDTLQQQYGIMDLYPLSPMQEGMLFHSLLDEGAAHHYFEQMHLHIAGNVDTRLVKQVMDDLVQRYEMLRTFFIHEGYPRPLQVVLKQRDISVYYEDIRSQCTSPAETEKQIQQYLSEEKKQQFNLERDVLMRLSVLQTGDNEFELIWSYHHILMDGWCMGIIFSEFGKLYNSYFNGVPATLSPVRPYSEYIRWLEEQDSDESAHYWKTCLEGYTAKTSLPQKHTRIHSETTRLLSQELVFDEEQTRQLQSFCSVRGVTLNTLLQTAWGILLGKYNGVSDAVFGSVVSGRPAAISGIEAMVGLFINTIPVRIKYKKEETISELLQRVQEAALNSELYQYHSLSEIQAFSNLGRDLIDHIMVVENHPLAERLKEDQAGMVKEAYQVAGIRVFEQVNYDLALIVLPGQTLYIRADYNANCYADEMILQVLTHLKGIINQAVSGLAEKLSDIQLATVAEREQIINEFNNTKADYPSGETIPSLFALQAQKNGHRPAVRFGENTLSYHQLNEMSDAIAMYLIKTADVLPGDLVGLMLERSASLMPVVFGILKAGAAYVPLDTKFPAARKQVIITDAQLKCLVSEDEFMTGLSGKLPYIALSQILAAIKEKPLKAELPVLDSQSLAYVIYTSGTTGVPKGVMIEHHAVINRLLWMQKSYPLNTDDVILQKTPLVFDVSVWELFWWSFVGASLCLLPPDGEKDPQLMADTILRYGVTTIHFVPSMLSVFLEEVKSGNIAGKLSRLKYVFASGEALKPEQVNAFAKLLHGVYGTRLINLYGPTEATVDVSHLECDYSEHCTRVTIGKPIDNIRLYVLDGDDHLAPKGVAGELCIAGAGLARGYLNNEKLTLEKFHPVAAAGNERIYRTGDQVRWLSDGTIDYLGRIDTQVKIRGLRIELEEIESQLQKIESVTGCVVLAKEKAGDKYLVAYYAAAEPVAAEVMGHHLAAILPAYMVPSFYVHVPEIPLTVNGKADRKALLGLQELPVSEYVAPANETEEKLAMLWSQILAADVAAISTTDDFFMLGGHSIKAIRLINEIRQAFGVQIKLRNLFEHKTIKKQALLINATNGSPDEQIKRIGNMASYPLSSAQERLYYEYLQYPLSLAYNIAGVFQVTGAVNHQRVHQAFRDLLHRHEALRTGFVLSDEGLVQKISNNTDIEPVLMDGVEHSGINNAFTSFVKPFDLSVPPLIRYGLMDHPAFGELLFIDVHHIVCDGISLNMLMNDFKQLYQGKLLRPPALRYVDYAAWQKNTESNLFVHKEYWKAKLSGGWPVLDLPKAPADADAAKEEAGIALLWLEKDLLDRVKKYTENANLSVFMFLLSVYYILLYRVSGNSDIIIGTDVAGRTSPALSDVVGTFINLLPLRVQVSDDAACAVLLQEVKECVLEAYDHQDFQFDEIMAMLKEQKPGDHHHLIDVHFAYASFIEESEEINELSFVPVTPQQNKTTQYGFKIEASNQDGQLLLQFIYSKALYNDELMQLLCRYYKNIVIGILDNDQVNPGTVELENPRVYMEQ